MAAYRNVLIPVDGGAASNRGLREGLRLARQLKSKVTLLHVVEDPVNEDVLERASFDPGLFAILRQQARRILARAQAQAKRAHIDARTVMVERPGWGTADVIVEQARKSRASLIVMGTHGRRGVRRLVLGSDAEQVVRLSTIPVCLMRAPGARS
jgi:nucleotide-binding universal stress UspA family protein